MKVYESVDQLVGHTPLLELKRVEEAHMGFRHES